MPQMAPLLWVMIYIITISFLYIFLTKFYFMKSTPKNKMKNDIKTIFNFWSF